MRMRWIAGRSIASPASASPMISVDGCPSHAGRQPALRRRRTAARGNPADRRADQPFRHSRLLPQPQRPDAGDPRRSRAPPISSCNTTSTTCSAWRANSPRRWRSISSASATSRSPTIPAETSPAPARSIIPILLRRLDALGYDGWIGANTSRRGGQRTGSAGFAPGAAEGLISRRRNENGHRIHRPRHHGRADGGPSHQGRPQSSPLLAAAARRPTRRRGRNCRSGPPARSRARARSSSSWCPTRPTSRKFCSARTASRTGSRSGKIVVDMSSISPIATKEFAKKIEALGCDYLDAPVSGGEVGAKAATLSIMVGGNGSRFRSASSRSSN